MTERPAPLKYYELTVEALAKMFMDADPYAGPFKIVDGIPSGAQVINSGFDQRREIFYITVEHESFDPVHEGQTIPKGTVSVEDVEENPFVGASLANSTPDNELERAIVWKETEFDESTIEQVFLREENKVRFESVKDDLHEFFHVGLVADYTGDAIMWRVWAFKEGSKWTSLKVRG